MDSLVLGSDFKTIGQGKATVLEVTKVAGKDNHYVKVAHPDLGNTPFIPYLATAGMYRVPRVGDNVYVFCKENFTQYPVAWGQELRPDQITKLIGSRKDDIMVLFSAGPQNNSVWHKIELDDMSEEGIRLTTHGGNRIELKDSSDITIEHSAGSKVLINKDVIELEIAGTKISLSKEGIIMTSAKGASLELTDKVLTKSKESSTIQLDSTVTVQSQDQLGTFDKVVVKTHTHSGNLGYPTSAPNTTT